MVHLLQSRTDEAIVWLEKARSANGRLPVVHAYLASAYALKGEAERASAEFAEAQRLSDNHYPTIASLKAGRYFGVPKFRAYTKPLFSLVCARPECRRNEPPTSKVQLQMSNPGCGRRGR